jgi:hypothetical protein
MWTRVGRYLACAMVGIFIPVLTSLAADDAPGEWSGTFALGVVSWSDLKDLDPAAGGSFDSVGYLGAFSVHRKVGEWGAADVLLGADFAVWATDSDLQGIADSFTQRGLYFTPSLRFRFGERDTRYLVLELGAGWYKVDFAELLCNPGPCVELQEVSDKDAFGGYLGVSSVFARWFFVEFQAHFTDFGEVTGFGADTGSLKGPIYMLNAGVTFGF